MVRAALLLSLLLACAAVRAAVSAHVEPQRPVAGQSLRLVIETTSDAEPDIAPLAQAFEVLGHSRTDQLAIRDGRMTRSAVHVYNLMPRASGRVVVPPLTVGSERTPPIALTIAAAPAAGGAADVRVEVVAQPRDPYVQSEVLLHVRILRQVDIANANLSEPVVDGDAVVRMVGRDRAFVEHRGGRRWRGIERVYAVYPQASGPLTIAPFTLTTQVVSGAGSLFDPFSRHVTTRRVQSAATVLGVRPRPADAPTPWLPARRVELREAWSQAAPQLRAGEPVTRTVAIIAEGLTAAQLPDLVPQAPPGVRVYPEPARTRDQESEDGMLGIRQQRIAFVPTRGGEFELPAIEVHWWDTAADVPRTATLPARRLSVLEADGSATAHAVPPAVAQPPADAAAPAAKARPPGWRRLAAALAVAALLLAAAAWWRRRARRRPRLATLRRHAARGDWRALEQGLLAWGRRCHPPACTLASLAARLDDDGRAALAELQARRFGRPAGADPAGGIELWQRLEPSLRALAARPRQSPRGSLAPLYLHR